MSAVRVRCPHCEGEIRVDLLLEAVGTPTRKGPKPTELDPEVEAFILSGIEVYRSSFSVMGKLLEEKGIHTPKGHRIWHPASVRREYEKAVERRKRAEAA